MQNRLKHLESLVKDAMAGKSPSNYESSSVDGYRANSSANVLHCGNEQKSSSIDRPFKSNGNVPMKAAFELPSISEDTRNSSGLVVKGLKETAYVGATHWAAMLEDVCQP